MTLRRRVADLLLDPRVVAAGLVVLAVVDALQELWLTAHMPAGEPYTRYNNFVIFRQAFVHLRRGLDLYAEFPAEHFDQFLYSPTFAVAMAPFAALPDWAGLVLWDLSTVSVFLLGVRSLPGLDVRTRMLLVWLVLPELQGSLQNSQSNPLVVGLLFLAFAATERDRPRSSALFLVAATYVKIFPAAAGLALLAHRGRARLLGWCLGWAVLLGLLPLVVVPPHELAWQYGNWLRLHTESRHAAGAGISVAAWLQAWFGLTPPRAALLAAGTALTALPLLRRSAHGSLAFRTAWFGAVLMYMVAFNHLAESPTFVVAVSGIGLWYFAQPRTPLHRFVLVATIVLTSALYSDLVPPGPKARLVVPWVLKVVPVLLAWAVAVVELSFRPPAPDPSPAGGSPAPATPAWPARHGRRAATPAPRPRG